jgi:hypothetical protein
MPHRSFQIPTRSAGVISLDTLGIGPAGVISSPITDGGMSFLLEGEVKARRLFSGFTQLVCGGQHGTLTLKGTSK